MYTISTEGYGDECEECPQVVAYSTVHVVEIMYHDYIPPPFKIYDAVNGVRDAAKRHDALARRRYVKPFKWFKFNRARKATAK
jgi:hypothetical protein